MSGREAFEKIVVPGMNRVARECGFSGRRKWTRTLSPGDIAVVGVHTHAGPIPGSLEFRMEVGFLTSVWTRWLAKADGITEPAWPHPGWGFYENHIPSDPPLSPPGWQVCHRTSFWFVGNEESARYCLEGLTPRMREEFEFLSRLNLDELIRLERIGESHFGKGASNPARLAVLLSEKGPSSELDALIDELRRSGLDAWRRFADFAERNAQEHSTSGGDSNLGTG